MNYEKIKSIALALLVLISLAFTWGIWNYQPYYETITDGAGDIVTEVEIGRQERISNLLKPSKIVSHIEESHYGTVSDEELTWVMQEIKRWNFYETENISASLNESEFKRLLTENGRTELFFTASVPFSTIKNLFSFQDTSIPNAVFNRMVIIEAEKESNTAFVYFISVEERLVFRSRVEAPSLTGFKQRYGAPSEHVEPYLAYQIPGGRQLFIRKQPPVLSVEKYLPEQIEAETFKQALFNDPSYVRRGSRSGNDEYTDGTSLMRVNSSSSVMMYVNPAQETEVSQPLALDQLIEKSIGFVNEHNGWVDNYRLFSAAPGSSSISYRLFAGDFPVFSLQAPGMAELSQVWGRERIYQYRRSSFILQLDSPLPEKEAPVELLSGEEAIDELLSKGLNTAAITDLRIGYEMLLNPEAPKIVTLRPAWYYEYNNSWQKLAEDKEGGEA